MRLSRKRAIELCIALWTWCMETGKRKEDWPEWEKYGRNIECYCWFCEYNLRQSEKYHKFEFGCIYCPYFKTYGETCETDSSYYIKWDEAKTPRTRKKYARLFLKQIRSLK